MNKNFNETEQKQIKTILLISWLIPFIGLYLMYLSKKTLFEKPKNILCKILNMNFTVILIQFMFTSLLQILLFGRFPNIVVYIALTIFISIFVISFISHIFATIKWLKNEDFNYKFCGDFFKPYENLEK